LIAILIIWLVQDWTDVILMKYVRADDRPFLIVTRLNLLGLFVFLCMLVWVVWRRRRLHGEQ